MKVIFLFLMLFSAAYLHAQKLEIEITGLRSNKGSVRLAFYNTAESFDNDQPALFNKTFQKSGMKNGVLKVAVEGLVPGTYGVALLDDENGNQEMDYRFFMPTEGFGFSDYYHTGMSRPKYNSFKFKLDSTVKKVTIRLRYL